MEINYAPSGGKGMEGRRKKRKGSNVFQLGETTFWNVSARTHPGNFRTFVSLS